MMEKAEVWTPPEPGAVPPPVSERAPVSIPPADPAPNGQAAYSNGFAEPLVQPAAANGHSSANGNGYAQAGGANGYANGNGASHGAPPPVGRSMVMHVLVPRPDDESCQRMLTQLHVLVEKNPGSDRIELTLLDRDGRRVALSGATIGVRHSPEVEEQLRQIAGPAAVRVTALVTSAA
jgi:hypothetical protein